MNFPEGDIFIPSLSFDDATSDEYVLPVANQSKDSIDLWPGFIVGENVNHKNDASQHGVDCFHLGDLLEEIKRRDLKTGEDFVCGYGVVHPDDICAIEVDSQPQPHLNTPSPTPDELSSTPGSPVPFSSIIGVGKVSPSQLEKCHRDGVDFDLSLKNDGPEVEVELLLGNYQVGKYSDLASAEKANL